MGLPSTTDRAYCACARRVGQARLAGSVAGSVGGNLTVFAATSRRAACPAFPTASSSSNTWGGPYSLDLMLTQLELAGILGERILPQGVEVEIDADAGTIAMLERAVV